MSREREWSEPLRLRIRTFLRNAVSQHVSRAILRYDARNVLDAVLKEDALVPAGEGEAIIGVDLASGKDKSMAVLRQGREVSLAFELTPERMAVMRGWCVPAPAPPGACGPCGGTGVANGSWGSGRKCPACTGTGKAPAADNNLPGNGAAAQAATPTVPSNAGLSHRHRCMRCGEEFDCRNVGRCAAGYDVLPSIVDWAGDVVEHCPPPAPEPPGACGYYGGGWCHLPRGHNGAHTYSPDPAGTGKAPAAEACGRCGGSKLVTYPNPPGVSYPCPECVPSEGPASTGKRGTP